MVDEQHDDDDDNDNNRHRPYDNLGEPSNPIAFQNPQQIRRGLRAELFLQLFHTAVPVQNVLIAEDLANDNNNLWQRHAQQQGREVAYWKSPFRDSIPTVLGHVEICHVLVEEVQHHQNPNVFRLTEEMVAIKVFDIRRIRQQQQRQQPNVGENALHEIAAMELLNNTLAAPHDENNDNNNLPLLGALDVLYDHANQTLNLILPYCNQGDMFNFLASNGRFPEPDARYYFRQVFQGLAYLHTTVGICHRDLSLENCMIMRVDNNNNNNNTVCHIIDLGMSLRVPYRTDPDGRVVPIPGMNNNLLEQQPQRPPQAVRCLFLPQGPCGKRPYMSPEIFANNGPFDGEAIDIWCAGVVLFCMITGNQSYRFPHRSDKRFRYMTQQLPELLEAWEIPVSEACLDLLQGMLCVDPRKRLTIDEVQNHPWFHQDNDDNDDAILDRMMDDLLHGMIDLGEE